LPIRLLIASYKGQRKLKMPEQIMVEVAFALPEKQLIIPVRVHKDCTVQEAIKESGIESKFDEIDLSINDVGIFGKLTTLDARLRDRDRVEIYRPLIADPKEIRRKRAAEGKDMKKGG
jgi:putative ubiquitin-RnfH superfamily antitoxin RatB of RatAB toxin-antitoxin module